MKIKSKKIISVPITKVYDLEVPINHNFVLASGIVVHNSKDLTDAVCGSVWSCYQNIIKGGTVVDSKMMMNNMDAMFKALSKNKLETALQSGFHQ